MKPFSLIVAAAYIAMLPVTAHAQESPPTGFTANQVMKGCQASVAGTRSEDINVNFWWGGLLGHGKRGHRVGWRCGRQTIAQRARVVTKYIEARPNRWHESFLKLTLEALGEAWPCKS